MVEVEVLQRLARGKAGGADAPFAAVGFPRGDLALQTGGEELLVRPALRAGPLGQALDRAGQRRSLSARVRNAISETSLRVVAAGFVLIRTALGSRR